MIKYIVEIKLYDSDTGWASGESGEFDDYSDAIRFMNEQNEIFDAIWSADSFGRAFPPQLIDI